MIIFLSVTAVGLLTRRRNRLTVISGPWQGREQWHNPAFHILIFVAFQRGQPDVRLAGVSPVNGLAVVTERLLRESFRVTAVCETKIKSRWFQILNFEKFERHPQFRIEIHFVFHHRT
jgi:hypothetical protein